MPEGGGGGEKVPVGLGPWWLWRPSGPPHGGGALVPWGPPGKLTPLGGGGPPLGGPPLWSSAGAVKTARGARMATKRVERCMPATVLFCFVF